MDALSSILQLAAVQIPGFMYLVARLSGLFFYCPVLSNRNIPALVKIGLILSLAVIVFPFLNIASVPVNVTDLAFAIGLLREIFVGLVLGFCAYLIFVGVQIAGQIIDYQMGFGFVNILDPESRIQIPIIGQLLIIFSTLLFLMMNGHHWLIQSIIKSTEVVPLGALSVSPELYNRINTLFTDVFVIAFKISAPIMFLMMLVDVAYGVIARAVPQANILIVGFPLKIGFGIWLLLVFLPVFFLVVKRIIVYSLLNLNILFKLMAHG